MGRPSRAEGRLFEIAVLQLALRFGSVTDQEEPRTQCVGPEVDVTLIDKHFLFHELELTRG